MKDKANGTAALPGGGFFCRLAGAAGSRRWEAPGQDRPGKAGPLQGCPTGLADVTLLG